MCGNNSSEAQHYTSVRLYVSTTSFLLLLLFNFIINGTIVREERLRGHARFVLVFHLLLSALVHLGTNSVFQYQAYRCTHMSRGACVAMVTILISSASNILLTLTAMALDRYCAVCHPMRYTSTCAAGVWPWLLGALTWMVALFIPLGLLLQAGDIPESGGECGPEQLKNGKQLQRVIFIAVCTVLILFSYARILVEGRRLGVLNRRNQAGCRTIALHGTQLAVYILPNFVIFVLAKLSERKLILESTKELSAVVVFAFFSLAQCVAPVIYGLRNEELLEQLGLRFPCCFRYLKEAMGWTLRSNWTHTHHMARERTLTAQTIISLEAPASPREEEEEEGEEESGSSASCSHDPHTDND